MENCLKNRTPEHYYHVYCSHDIEMLCISLFVVLLAFLHLMFTGNICMSLSCLPSRAGLLVTVTIPSCFCLLTSLWIIMDCFLLIPCYCWSLDLWLWVMEWVVPPCTTLSVLTRLWGNSATIKGMTEHNFSSHLHIDSAQLKGTWSPASRRC